MNLPKFKLIKIEDEQLIAITIKDYSELCSKIGELEGEIIALKLKIPKEKSK